MVCSGRTNDIQDWYCRYIVCVAWKNPIICDGGANESNYQSCQSKLRITTKLSYVFSIHKSMPVRYSDWLRVITYFSEERISHLQTYSASISTMICPYALLNTVYLNLIKIFTTRNWRAPNYTNNIAYSGIKLWNIVCFVMLNPINTHRDHLCFHKGREHTIWNLF